MQDRTFYRDIAKQTRKMFPRLLKQDASLDDVEVFNFIQHSISEEPLPKLPPIYVYNEDVLSVASKLINEDRKSSVAIQNLASQKRPGGGWEEGSDAQEESISRRTTLCLSLTNNPKKSRPLYPLEDHMLYSPNVRVISLDDGVYLPDEKRFTVSVLSCPALNMRGQGKQDKMTEQQFAETKDRIFTMLMCAKKHRHQRLVLGAMGCGVFKNPVMDVINAYRQVLGENDWSCFRDIHFAILDRNQGCPLFQAFQKAFSP